MTPYKEFNELFMQCYRYCMPVLSRYVSTKQDAEDAFTEAMTTYWLYAQRGDIKNQDNIPAFVCTTAIRLLYKQKKKGSKLAMVDADLSNKQAIEELLSLSLDQPLGYKQSLLKKAFEKLGKACQRLLIVKYIYEYSYEEIAEDFGHKTSHVAKTQTHRCIKRIKTYFAGLVAKTKNKAK